VVNVSVNYMLKSAFQYELTNHVDLEIARLRQNASDTADAQQRLVDLCCVRDYLLARQAKLTP